MRLFFYFLFFAFSAPVLAQPVTFDLDSNHIDITTEFNGERLVVYGVRRGNGDVTVTVEGPKHDMRVRRKGRILGAWVNKSSMVFKEMPAFYDYAVTEGAEDVHGAAFLPFETGDKDKNFAAFKEAFIRNNQEEGLYPQTPQIVHFYEKGDLFRAEFSIPPNVPVGDYEVKVFYEENNLTILEKKNFKISQVGMNAGINVFARHYSLPYGLLCVVLALFAGWFSNRVRRRA